MARLSINGFMAGVTLCGQTRSRVIDRGEDVFHPNIKLLENHIYRKKSAWNVLLFGTTPSDPPTPCRACSCMGLRPVISEDIDMADIIVLILTLLF